MLIEEPAGTFDCEGTVTFLDAAMLVQIEADRRGRSLILNHNGGVRCTIDGNSNLGALSAAFNRGLQTKGPRTFGPDAPRVLSPEQLLSDHSIDANRRQVEATPEMNRVAMWNKIGFTVYDVAPRAWSRWREYVYMGLENQALGKIGRTEIAAAWRVGCLAQVLAGRGQLSKQSWNESLKANFEGAGLNLIVAILRETWQPYNRQIRRFYP